MMLTTKGRYAVTAIIDIAMNFDGKPVNLAEVSSRQNIAQNYLEQIFQKLKVKGVVKSSRGPGGGYVLANGPEDIKISQIIDAVGESVKITKCADKIGCVKENVKCLTHDLWDGLAVSIMSYLDNISIADVIKGDVGNDISR